MGELPFYRGAENPYCPLKFLIRLRMHKHNDEEEQVEEEDEEGNILNTSPRIKHCCSRKRGLTLGKGLLLLRRSSQTLMML
jgi:hypothetical protein